MSNGAPILQSGNVTPGHAAAWTTDGVVQDAGAATSGALSEVGITKEGGIALAINNTATSNMNGYVEWGVGVANTGTITLYAESYGGAPAATLEYNINGVVYPFNPAGSGNITGPTIAVSGDLVSFNGTTGALVQDSGIAGSAVAALANLTPNLPPALATITVLQAATTTTLTQTQCIVLGYHAAGDGGGGLYRVGTTTTANGSTIINDASGRSWYLELFGKPISAGQAGILPSNTSSANTTAFTALLAVGVPILFPPGVFQMGEGFSVSLSGQVILGSGVANPNGTGTGTLIQVTTNSAAPWLTVASDANWVQISNFTLTRAAATPGAGSHGIVFAGINENCNLHDVLINNQNIGLSLNTADTGYVTNVLTQGCSSHGISITNSASYDACQWALTNVGSTNNAGSGIAVSSVAGPAQLIVGQWTNIATFANSLAGVAFTGISGVPISDVRIADSFLGSDAEYGVFMSYCQYGKINNTTIERVGLDPTGPGNATPATNAGVGIGLDPHSNNIGITNCLIETCSSNGIFTTAVDATVTGCTIIRNGAAQAGAAFQTGVTNNAGGIVSVFASNRVGNIPGEAQQLFGMSNGGTINVYDGNDDSGNQSAAFDGVAPVAGYGNWSGSWGIKTGSAAAAGQVGEYISASVASGSAVALASTTPINITSISLTAGDWDVEGTFGVIPAASTTVNSFNAGVSGTSATLPTDPGAGGRIGLNGGSGAVITTGGQLEFATGRAVVNISSPETFYLVGQVGFGVSTCGGYGFIGARRVR